MTTSSIANALTNGSSSTQTLGSGTQTAQQQAASETASSQQSLAGNMNTFLQLLTTQLQYQDPLNPMDTAQFTDQLVQFAQVQQQIDINQNLETMLSSQNNAALASSANYLGTTVTAVSGSLPLQNSNATFYYTTPASTSNVNIVITDSAGNIVDTMAGVATAGTNTATWNGLNSDGQQEPDGIYNVAVSAIGSSGSTTQLDTAVSGTVTAVAVDPSNNETQVLLGGVGVDLSNIIEIQAYGSTGAANSGAIGTALQNAQAAQNAQNSGASNTNTGS